MHTMETLLPLLAKHGIGRMGSKFYCMSHECLLEAEPETLGVHLEEHKDSPEVLLNSSCEAEFGSTASAVLRFKHKLWKVDLASTNAGLNLQLGGFEHLQSPFILRDDSPFNNFLGSLRNDVFTKEDLGLMFRVASHLEVNGDPVDRSASIQGSKMNAFGMRWFMGDTGW